MKTLGGQSLRQGLIASLMISAVAHGAELGSKLAQPAGWQRHNLLIEFHALPKRYSCNDLWYKTRDVLLRLGADTRMDILPYRCERALGPQARSPRVRLEFYLPAVRSGAQASAADFKARIEDVRIAPGEPASINNEDCALLRQMKASLPGRIVRFHLNCLAPPRGDPPFSVTYQALRRIDNPAVHAAAR
jgi:hypothetical protein